jgi:dTDP-4-dehydrorhamnose reductase
MRFLVTGARGTVGQVLVPTLEAAGHEVHTWDRDAIPPEDAAAGARHVEEVRPHWVCHLAMGPEEWAGRLAAEAGERGARMLQVSSAMVFDASSPGPYTLDAKPGPGDDYGRYKLRQEELVQAADPLALIVRIGWQIGTARGGNQMLEALHAQAEADGEIAASRKWIPATSFLDDTCEALLALMERGSVGLHHLDSNAGCAWTYDRLVAALGERYGDPGWSIRVHEDYVHDQRLIDARVPIPTLADRLG